MQRFAPLLNLIDLTVKQAAGGDGKNDLFFDEAADTPYEVYKPDPSGSVLEGKEILVLTTAGKRVPFGEVSPMSLALGRQLSFRRLHVAPEWKDVAANAILQG